MASSRIRVVLVEDDPMVQEVNRMFIERVDGYEIVGTASDGVEGMQLIRRLQPDLVFLDIYMPVQDGLETLNQIRREQLNTDVIMITAAKDVSTVQGLLRLGVFDYIIKPFKFERVKQSLENYRAFQFGMEKEQQISQDRLDHILHKSGPAALEERKPDTAELPKGLNALTLKQVLGLMGERQKPLSAEEVADGIGVARVTARRYLDYLEKTGKVSLDIQYGGVGRPVNRYRLE
ncbi:response regulator [Ferviditalea candida]|uniref:Transcriptional regulatory protein n=1 Tax=Ferviditalea candida TaxID=3108399 RepID=A0ABU5ZEU3_9BACL|nr:response regulator [Paenibacillaceae bacterium T2]